MRSTSPLIVSFLPDALNMTGSSFSFVAVAVAPRYANSPMTAVARRSSFFLQLATFRAYNSSIATRLRSRTTVRNGAEGGCTTLSSTGNSVCRISSWCRNTSGLYESVKSTPTSSAGRDLWDEDASNSIAFTSCRIYDSIGSRFTVDSGAASATG